MKIAIMQPYFFPYMGYFALMRACDLFVVFDDVQYLRRGWMNRNIIRCANNKTQYITVPVQKSPRDTKISQVKIDYSSSWHQRHIRSLLFNYRRSEIIEMYENVPSFSNLSDLLVHTLKETCRLLGFKKKFIHSSCIKATSINETGCKKRIIEICKEMGADCYLNLPGGRSLYLPDDFKRHGLDIEFIRCESEKKLSVLDYLSEPKTTSG